MGGTDDQDNLVEVSLEKHMNLHKQLYEDLGSYKDYIAWQGLAGLLSTEECRKLAIIEGAKEGARITNEKRWANHIKKDRLYPKGVDGRKIRKSRYWFNNGVEEGQFSLENPPEGWYRGRLKRSSYDGPELGSTGVK